MSMKMMNAAYLVDNVALLSLQEKAGRRGIPLL